MMEKKNLLGMIAVNTNQNKNMKTHFATCDKANESDNNDYWSVTLCGIENPESPISDKIVDVNCKKCLKRYQKLSDEF